MKNTTKSYEQKQADIRDINKRYNIWASNKFVNSTPISSLKGLMRECKEAIDDIESLNKINENCDFGDKDLINQIYNNARIEYADCLMYLIDSARRFGLSLDDLFLALDEKLQINLKRDWKQNEDKSYSHVK